MKASRLTLTMLSAAALIGASACSNADKPVGPADSQTDRPGDSSSMSSDSDSSSDSSGSESTSSSSSTSSAAQVDPVLAAIAAAEEEAGGTAYEVDDQDEDGTWEIDVSTGDRSVEVEVASDGTATAGEEEDLDDDDRAGLEAAKVDLAQAITTALEEVDGTFDEAELEKEQDAHHWKVSIDVNGDDRDVLVDVVTGKASPERDG